MNNKLIRIRKSLDKKLDRFIELLDVEAIERELKKKDEDYSQLVKKTDNQLARVILYLYEQCNLTQKDISNLLIMPLNKVCGLLKYAEKHIKGH